MEIHQKCCSIDKHLQYLC